MNKWMGPRRKFGLLGLFTIGIVKLFFGCPCQHTVCADSR